MDRARARERARERESESERERERERARARERDNERQRERETGGIHHARHAGENSHGKVEQWGVMKREGGWEKAREKRMR